MAARRAPACKPDEHARKNRPAVDDAQIERAAEMLSAASDPSRLRLLLVLAGGPLTVGALAARVDGRAELVSRQLSVLRIAGLVRGTRKGQFVHYALADEHAEMLVESAVAYAARLGSRSGFSGRGGAASR